MANEKPLRQTLESQGYSVYWQGKGKPIKVSKGSQTFEIAPSEYQVRSGTAFVSPDVLGRFSAKETASPTQTAPTEPLYKQVPGQIQSDVQKYQEQERANFERFRQQQEDVWNRYYAEQQQRISDYMGQMNQLIQQYSDAGIQMLKQYQEQYGQSLATLKQLMQPDPTVPETVKVALDMLEKRTEENARLLDEEMNRRGRYQSSYAMDKRRELYSDLTTDQQQILAQWIDQQHKQMTDATLRYAAAQADFAQNYANLYGQVTAKPIEMGMGLAQELLNRQSALGEQQWQMRSGLLSQQQAMESNLAQVGLNTAVGLRQWLAEQEAAAQRAQAELEAQRAQQEWEQQKFLANLALQQAQLQETQRHNIAMERRPVGGGGGLTAYQMYQIAQKQAEQQAKAEAEKTLKSTAARAGTDLTTAGYILNLSALKDNAVAVRRQIEADMKDPAKASVDWNKVIQEADKWYPWPLVSSLIPGQVIRQAP
ncbi:hypothetical protein [Gelria sp. Kuro-4]|uniref:hypothetical protein n=1 Tax=Gelria sp. Kuro-4 TaxID=2796927 RepID=UPI001BEFC8DC|nr:hypothetical protein [Gelria sp. Kuro-4]BCV23302.1 hypothetical protein kuro4_00750 [Gelria sp. Kuro-4]